MLFTGRSLEKNNNATGIILPVTRTSDDTAEMVIYRAQALGAGNFGEPAEIGRVAIGTKPEQSVRSGQYTLIVNPENTASIDLAFFDGDIQPGYSYKYWAGGSR